MSLLTKWLILTSDVNVCAFISANGKYSFMISTITKTPSDSERIRYLLDGGSFDSAEEAISYADDLIKKIKEEKI